MEFLAVSAIFGAAIGFVIVSFFYLYRAWRVLIHHLTSVKAFFSNIENRTLAWLRRFLVILAIAWLASAVEMVGELVFSKTVLPPLASAIIEAGWVFGLSFLALRERLHGEQDTPSAEVRKSVGSDEGNPASRSDKYARSSLSPEQAARITRKLDAAMGEAGLHRDPSLTLRDLADHTGVNSHRISHTLNVHMGVSFFDYVNGWRVKDACERLTTADAVILAIAEDVGFNSRSTFNTAFKKEMGQTPSAYRKAATSA